MRIAGFAVVAEAEGPGDAATRGRADRLLAAFVGPYGDATTTGHAEGSAWAGYAPEDSHQLQRLSEWSTHSDEHGLCVIEGDFYSSTSQGLAPRLLTSIRNDGPGAVDDLNGAFSGVVCLAQPRRAWLFVDRLGARMLYYRVTARRLEVATNLYGFRHDSPTLDVAALNEHLILGFPTDSKTLVAGVRLVPPGHVLEWSPGKVCLQRYHRWPRRLDRQSVRDSAAMIQAALDRHLKDLPPAAASAGIALSDGLDSRVVLAALLRAQRAPLAITFPGRDLTHVRRLTAGLGLSERIIAKPERGGIDVQWDSAVLQDGCGGGWGFLSMALAAEGRPLFTGFGGDVLSGSWSGLQPWSLTSPEALAVQEYAIRGPMVAPELVRTCLRPDLVRPADTVFEAWRASVRRECAETDLLTGYLRHRISHRNRRRIAPIFTLMRSQTPVIHPFADRGVLETYLTLPRSSLVGQGAHSLAAMAGPPVLGRVPAGSLGLPLTWQFRLRGGLETLRRLRTRWPARHPAPVSLTPWQQRHLAIARESELFDPKALDDHRPDLFAAIGHLAVTAIHVACLTGAKLPSAPSARFLRDRR